MLSKLLPVILLILGTGGGIGAGILLMRQRQTKSMLPRLERHRSQVPAEEAEDDAAEESEEDPARIHQDYQSVRRASCGARPTDLAGGACR